MTENIKIAMQAINKWYYYAMNYNVVEVEVADFDGNHVEYLPDFFNAFPLYLRKHLEEKWKYGCETYDSRAALMWLYGELDGTNRKLLIEWVLSNYNDECILSFKEGE